MNHLTTLNPSSHPSPSQTHFPYTPHAPHFALTPSLLSTMSLYFSTLSLSINQNRWHRHGIVMVTVNIGNNCCRSPGDISWIWEGMLTFAEQTHQSGDVRIPLCWHHSVSCGRIYRGVL